MAERLVKNITSDYLTCSICVNIFSNPKMLNCGHSFCARCLEDYISSILRTSNGFECPICRFRYNIDPEVEPTSWISNLNTDDISLSILRAIGQHTAPKPGVVQQIDGPESLAPEAEKEISIGSVCGRHFGKKLDVYCSKHDIVVCSECALLEHQDEACECLSAAKVIEKRYCALKCLVAQQVSDATQLIDSRVSGTNGKSVERLHDDFQKSITEVEESFREIYAAFSKRIENIRIKAKQSVSHDESVASVNQLQSRLVQHIKTFDEVASTTNPNETMRLISEMCSSSSELQENIHDLSNKVNSGSLLKFADNDLNLLDAYVSSAKQTFPEDFLTYEETAQLDNPEGKDFVMVTKSGQFLDNQDATADTANVDGSRRHTFSAKLDGEEKCALSGVALIGTVAVVVVDQTNRSLKKFKIPEGRFLNNLVVQYEPHQIANIRETNTVAVSVWDVSKILIVATDPMLEIIRVVNTNAEYIGVISHKLDCLAASSVHARRVDILDINPGNTRQDPRVATIYQSSRKRSFPDRLTSTGSGNIVVRVRHRNEISCFGDYHNLLWSRRIKTRISDVTCFRGRIFASLQDTNDIVYFREDGSGELTSLKKDGGDWDIRRPWSMDGFKDCLVVTEDTPSHLIHLFVFA